METLFDSLREAWLLLSPEGRSVAVVSPLHADGVVAPLYTDRGTAEEVAATYAGIGEFKPYPVPPLWQAGQMLAAQGFAGITIDGTLPLFFVTDSPERELPTHVALPRADDYLLLGEDDILTAERDDIEFWRDYPAFDRLSIAWLLGEQLPYAGYEPDMPLWEYLVEGESQPVSDPGALLEVARPGGSGIALFSEAFAARWYWQQVLGEEDIESEERGGDVVAQSDVPMLLDKALASGWRVILNPSRHRFFQGFFRRAGEQWFLITINGVWRVEPPFHCTQVARRV